MQALVVAWQIYQMTKDPLALGMIGLVEAVVFIIFATWAGHFTDRHEKRAIILTTQGVLLVCAATFFALSRRPGMTLYWYYGIVALTGLARSYMWPASFAYSELTVPREIYARAASLNSTSWEVASILGPAMGGFIYTWRGPTAAYLVVMVLSVLAIVFTIRMGIKPAKTPSTGPRGHDLLAGFRFVFANPVILSAISLDMFAVLFGGVYAILPIFADHLGVGAKGLGWLRAAPSIGAIVMATYQAWRPPLMHVGKTLFFMVGLFGIFTVAFAFSTSFWMAMVLLGATGIVDNVSVVIRASVIQAFTPDDMRGRVSSVNGIFIGSSNEIGAFESGLAAKLMGTVPSVVFGGLMTLVTVAVVAWKSPTLIRLKNLHKTPTK